METVQVVDGKLTNVKTPVVEDFRTKFIQPILTEFGVPKEDAGKIASDYRFKNSQTSVLYNFIADAVYQYIDADKKFNFPNRKDFCGSIYLKENDEAVVERDIRDIKDHKTITGHKKERRMKHKTIVKKSTCDCSIMITIPPFIVPMDSSANIKREFLFQFEVFAPFHFFSSYPLTINHYF